MLVKLYSCSKLWQCKFVGDWSRGIGHTFVVNPWSRSFSSAPINRINEFKDGSILSPIWYLRGFRDIGASREENILPWKFGCLNDDGVDVLSGQSWSRVSTSRSTANNKDSGAGWLTKCHHLSVACNHTKRQGLLVVRLAFLLFNFWKLMGGVRAGACRIFTFLSCLNSYESALIFRKSRHRNGNMRSQSHAYDNFTYRVHSNCL